MKDYCLATVVYPGAEQYFSEFFGALENIPEINKADLAIIRQGDIALPDLSNITVFDIDESCSIARVRAFMFQKIADLSTYKHYIFSDIDDRLLPESFSHHSAALQAADFSYGDVNLYDESLSKPYNKRLFEISDIPQELNTVKGVMHGHFTGLSALALNAKALNHIPLQFPEGVTFLDYWLVCELLAAGMQGKRAECVLDYRLNHNSYDALHSSQEFDVLLRRLDQAIHTFENVSGGEAVTLRLKTLYNLRNCLHNQPQSVILALSKIVPEWIVWFEDIFLLADYFYQETS